jgi:hypothetical protein
VPRQYDQQERNGHGCDWRQHSLLPLLLLFFGFNFGFNFVFNFGFNFVFGWLLLLLLVKLGAASCE